MMTCASKAYPGTCFFYPDGSNLRLLENQEAYVRNIQKLICIRVKYHNASKSEEEKIF
jgi:hypothetical protein